MLTKFNLSQFIKDHVTGRQQSLLQNDFVAPGTYNIADDEPLSTNRLIELIAASKAKKAKIGNINPRIISLTARMGDKIHLPLNSERFTLLVL